VDFHYSRRTAASHGIMEHMTKKDTPKPKPTPFDSFTKAAQKIFNLPKRDVESVKGKTPPPPRKKN
jgi:hypothetical protein